MSKHYINNFEDLALDQYRRDALEIAEAGLGAIDSESIIYNSIKIEGDSLQIKDRVFDLQNFKTIKVIGFGKASSKAAKALEKILKDKISAGIIIDKEPDNFGAINVYTGTHPRPSLENLKIAEQIVDMAEKSKEDDLVIVIVSGGGSAMLCWPEQECVRGQELYDSFLKTGATITELNTVRKHTSLVKGGGLAKILYPATVIGLIFSDVPGENYNQVASGPTFKDESTKEDAQKIIDKFNLGNFELIETPKEDKYFEKVDNIVLVSNTIAIEAMQNKAREFGYTTSILSTENYQEADPTIQELKRIASSSKSAALAGGEIRLKIDSPGGSGGRNSFLGLKAISEIDDFVLVSIASDGTDNGPSAGVIVDRHSLTTAQELGLDMKDYLERYDSFTFFEKIKDTIWTNLTGANVSDLIILIKK